MIYLIVRKYQFKDNEPYYRIEKWAKTIKEARDIAKKQNAKSTIDNSATYTEIRLLTKSYKKTRSYSIINFFLSPPDKNLALTLVRLSNSNLEIKSLILLFLRFFSFINISPIAFKFSSKVKSWK